MALTSSSASSSVLYGANPTPDPAADPVDADPVGERFRVIVPIGSKDAVSVAEFPAYVAGLLPFQRKGDGGGLGAFGLVQRQAGGTREPSPDDIGKGVFVPFDALEAGDEAFAARGTGAEPEMKSTAGTMDAMASWLCVPVSSLPGAVEGAGCRR